MKYPIIPLILQIIALIFLLIAISFDIYTLYVDGRWFYRVGGDNEYVYFLEIKRKFLLDWFSTPYDVNPKFRPHHRPRVFPIRGTYGNFLRYSKSEPFIFLAFLCVTAVILIILIVLTFVRKRQFLPGPCRQNGSCYLILALVIIFAATAEITHRFEVQHSYDDYKVFEKSPSLNTKIGAWMLGSCGKDKESYEALLGSRLIKERDDLHVCQFWYGFLASAILALIGALFLIIIFIFLCMFWSWKYNIDKADEESVERDCKDQDEGSNANEDPCVDEGEVEDGDNGDENANIAREEAQENPELFPPSPTPSKVKGPERSKSATKSKSKSPKKKSPKRKSPKKKSPKKKSPKKKSPKKKSPKRRSPRSKKSTRSKSKSKSPKKKSPKRSPKKKSPKKKSPKAKSNMSPKQKSTKKSKSPKKK